MKKIAILGALVAVGAIAAPSHAQLRGSDTLFDLTQGILANCPAAAPLTYDGQGSSVGETALALGPACTTSADCQGTGGAPIFGTCVSGRCTVRQQIAPMSRSLRGTTTGGGACASPNEDQAECKIVGLDAITIVGDADNSFSDPHGADSAFNNKCCIQDETAPQCFNVVDNPISYIEMPDSPVCTTNAACTAAGFAVCQLPNNLAPLVGAATCPAGQRCRCGTAVDPDTTASTAQYCPGSDLDILRIIFAGTTADGVRNCASDVRYSLVSTWGNMFRNDCSGLGCASLNHAFRRGDLSGTTDTFLSLTGLPAVSITAGTVTGQPVRTVSTVFCNGNEDQDNDPIRRECVADDDVCNNTGDAGLVLPVGVPESVDLPVAYATVAAGSSTPARQAQAIPLVGGATRFNCPERLNFSIAGNCLTHQAPAAANGSANLKARTAVTVFSPDLADDGRHFNLFARLVNGNIIRDAAGNQVVNGWYRMRSNEPGTYNCQQADATDQIGCFAGKVACSTGFAGRTALGTDADANGVPDAEAFLLGSQAQIACSTTADCTGIGLGAGATCVGNVCQVSGAPVAGCIPPNNAEIQELLVNSPNRYPLARRLYLCSISGFDNLVAGSDEAELSACYESEPLLTNQLGAVGFVPLPAQPSCTLATEATACATWGSAAAGSFVPCVNATTNARCGAAETGCVCANCEDFNEAVNCGDTANDINTCM